MARSMCSTRACSQDVLSQGDWGLGWAFVFGRWESPDPYRLCLTLLLNEHAFRPYIRRAKFISPYMQGVERQIAKDLSRQEDVSRRTISQSYDVGNDFFSLWCGSIRALSVTIRILFSENRAYALPQVLVSAAKTSAEVPRLFQKVRCSQSRSTPAYHRDPRISVRHRRAYYIRGSSKTIRDRAAARRRSRLRVTGALTSSP